MQQFFTNHITVFLENHVFTLTNLLQLSAVVIGFVFAFSISYLLKRVLGNRFFNTFCPKRVQATSNVVTFPTIWTIILWTIVAACKEFNWNYTISHIVAQFSTAWLVIRLLSLLNFHLSVKKLAAIVIYTITALNALGLLSHIINILDKFALGIGDLKISLLSVIKGGAIFFTLTWLSVIVTRWVKIRLKKFGKVEPSLQELFTKLIRVFFIAFAVLITLSSMGLDLSTFAVFSGAIGVGIGFGLQKVISNLICGIILLLDRSIKPGDVIALDKNGSYGEINKLGARYVSVRTRSGKEHLIPNEDFIIYKSENWSLSDSLIRLSLKMRAGLDSDVNLVMKLLVDASKDVDRVVEEKAPAARLRSFSESAIEFELRIWINDPHNGISKVKSDIYINIWNLFRENGITIPYPHRDIHISSNSEDKLRSLKDSHLSRTNTSNTR